MASVWQRLGATFGSDTNAETSPTQTVFKLDLPNATATSVNESFKLLSGMMIAPTLSEANVRTEVPIVMAEMRVGRIPMRHSLILCSGRGRRKLRSLDRYGALIGSAFRASFAQNSSAKTRERGAERRALRGGSGARRYHNARSWR